MADNRIKKFWREDRGMMTVEAAVIVPMIAMILVGIVFLFLFFMDMAAARSEAMRVAEETAAAWKTDGELVTGGSGMISKATLQELLNEVVE